MLANGRCYACSRVTPSTRHRYARGSPCLGSIAHCPNVGRRGKFPRTVGGRSGSAWRHRVAARPRRPAGICAQGPRRAQDGGKAQQERCPVPRAGPPNRVEAIAVPSPEQLRKAARPRRRHDFHGAHGRLDDRRGSVDHGCVGGPDLFHEVNAWSPMNKIMG
jgi:hypothetical protein